MVSLPPEAGENSDQLDYVSSMATDVSPELFSPKSTYEAYLTEKSMEERPVKRQKQGSLSIDISPALPPSGTTSAAIGNADAPIALTSADEIDDFSSMIHPSVAEIIKLESIPSVEPLECLSPRDVAGKLDSCPHMISRLLFFGAHYVLVFHNLHRARIRVADWRHTQL